MTNPIIKIRPRTGRVALNGRLTNIYVREGSYIGTNDDRLGRWYAGDINDDFFRPFGAGKRTRVDAAKLALADAGAIS